MTIDSFSTFQPGLFYEVLEEYPPADDIWYSPYGGPTSPPGAVFHDTVDALGGQRDLICGHVSNSELGSSASMSVDLLERSMSVGISLGYFGSCYVQWDGDDAAGGSSPFPGAALNSSPGIGSGGNSYSTDGQSMDFTFGGLATAITSTIKADHDVYYYYNVINMNGETNKLQFFTAGGEQEYTFSAYFRNGGWDNDLTYDWTRVVAFQVRIQTAESSGTTSTAVDTEDRKSVV